MMEYIIRDWRQPAEMERISESNRVTSLSRCENNKNFQQKKTALEIEMDLAT